MVPSHRGARPERKSGCRAGGSRKSPTSIPLLGRRMPVCTCLCSKSNSSGDGAGTCVIGLPLLQSCSFRQYCGPSPYAALPIERKEAAIRGRLTPRAELGGEWYQQRR